MLTADQIETTGIIRAIRQGSRRGATNAGRRGILEEAIDTAADQATATRRRASEIVDELAESQDATLAFIDIACDIYTSADGLITQQASGGERRRQNAIRNCVADLEKNEYFKALVSQDGVNLDQKLREAEEALQRLSTKNINAARRFYEVAGDAVSRLDEFPLVRPDQTPMTKQELAGIIENLHKNDVEFLTDQSGSLHSFANQNMSRVSTPRETLEGSLAELFHTNRVVSNGATDVRMLRSLDADNVNGVDVDLRFRASDGQLTYDQVKRSFSRFSKDLTLKESLDLCRGAQAQGAIARVVIYLVDNQASFQGTIDNAVRNGIDVVDVQGNRLHSFTDSELAGFRQNCAP